jgi:hypothetical protein
MSESSNDREQGDPPPPLEMQRKLARTVTNPAVRANQTIIQWSGLTGTPFDRGLLLELEAQIAAIQAGSLDRPTAVLAAHVETLNAVFYALIRSAFEYRGSPHEHEKLKLAMRVQARVAATVQKLVDIKSPRPVAYVQQANIAHGPQQVNNLAHPNTLHGREVGNPPNELLEQQPNGWLDTRTTHASGSSNQAMEAVGAVHGTKDNQG